MPVAASMAVTWRRYDLRGRAAPPRRRGLCARRTNGVTSRRLRARRARRGLTTRHDLKP
jgi:hypothetical protein